MLYKFGLVQSPFSTARNFVARPRHRPQIDNVPYVERANVCDGGKQTFRLPERLAPTRPVSSPLVEAQVAKARDASHSCDDHQGNEGVGDNQANRHLVISTVT